MDIIGRLFDKEEWEAYFNYKIEIGNISKHEEADLRLFIDNQEYLPVAEKIKIGTGFMPAKKTLLNKAKTDKKRIVYTYCREENYVLKLITFMLRDYDSIFAPNLYSFRKERGVKTAVRDVLKIKKIDEYFTYKVDISDYFNSIDVSRILPKLENVLKDDVRLYEFVKGLLECPFVEYEGQLIEERKGIMAGTPTSTFLANLYLKELDFYFSEKGIPYARYSDDIIVFAKTYDELQFDIDYINRTLESRGLSINKKKEFVSFPGEEWNFLGFSYKCGIIDVCRVSVDKMKAKMRRKARALRRWAARKNVSGEKAAAVFIKRFNEKLYDNPIDNELTWTRWFFPVINTDVSLRKIDSYMQECVRYLVTGKRTNAKYNCRYDDMKLLGYVSLVNEYYKRK